MTGKTPYSVRIQPTLGIQARVRAWHNSSGTLILDASVWRPNVRDHARRLAMIAIARDREARRTVARNDRKNLRQ